MPVLLQTSLFPGFGIGSECTGLLTLRLSFTGQERKVNNCGIYIFAWYVILCLDIHGVYIGRHQPVPGPADLHVGVHSSVQGQEDRRASTTHLRRR